MLSELNNAKTWHKKRLDKTKMQVFAEKKGSNFYTNQTETHSLFDECFTHFASDIRKRISEFAHY